MTTYSPLLTDYYQFTMAYSYWALGRAEQESIFQLTFRKNPFKGNYAIACGLASVIEYLNRYRFSDTDIAYLKTLKSGNKPTFPKEFLDYLAQLKFTCEIEAIPEGTVVFPQEPLLRIKGPILQCQLLETPMINLINFASLVATRASQICQIASNTPVVEFGLRRAQGPDGGITASRAAYIGGCTAVSNVLAGKLFDIPVVGTQAHSWIMSYPDEYTAFMEFVRVNDNTTLLVDTYDSIRGVKNAIRVGEWLRKEDRDLFAIRLDSGDLLALSKNSRRVLDDAGFTNTKIMASGDLSVDKIKKLKAAKAPIDMWGVGTRLVTAYEQPSLDAIYKLTAIKENNQWQYKMKISDAPDKMTWPGIHQVKRYYRQGKFLQDVIYDLPQNLSLKAPAQADNSQDLLVSIFQQGKLVYSPPSTKEIRSFCLNQVKQFIQSNKKTYLPKLDTNLEKIKTKFLKTKH